MDYESLIVNITELGLSRSAAAQLVTA
jgi:hypothetical protein